MKFLKKNWGNLLFIMLIVLLLIPQTGTPIKVFIQRIISFSPSEIAIEEREVISEYDWNLVSLSTTEVINFSTSEGKVILLNFWATWCPPCIAEMPSLQKLYNTYGNDVDFYFVTSEEPQRVKTFMENKGYTFPVQIQTQKAPDILENSSLPTTYLISKKGEIVIEKQGAANWNSDRTRGLLKQLLNK